MSMFQKRNSEPRSPQRYLTLATSNSQPVTRAISIKKTSERLSLSPLSHTEVVIRSRANSDEEISLICQEQQAEHKNDRKNLVVFKSKAKKSKDNTTRPLHLILNTTAKGQRRVLSLIKQVLVIFHIIAHQLEREVINLFNKIQSIWIDIVNVILELLNKEKIRKPYTKDQKGKQLKPLTVVLDLDETLIHSSKAEPKNPYESIRILQKDGTHRQIFVQKRPNLSLFLNKISEVFNVVIFTASHMKYADAVLELIDKDTHISRKLYRQSCKRVDNKWIKDLTLLDLDLSRVIFIDNEEAAGSLQPDNHLHIKSWFDCEEDKELLKFMEVLLEFAREWEEESHDVTKKDIRNFIVRKKREFAAALTNIKENIY